MPALSYTGVTFASTTYKVTNVSVRDMKDQIDVTTLNDTRRQYQAAPLFQAAEATVDFMGYGPRAGATGSFSAPGVSGIGGTVVSSSLTLQLNEPVRSQATIQFTRS